MMGRYSLGKYGGLACVIVCVTAVFIPIVLLAKKDVEHVHPPAPPPEICITRFYSDVDGTELRAPLVQHYDGQNLRDYRGVVIVKHLDDGGFQVTVLTNDNDTNRVTWNVREIAEFQRYGDQGDIWQ